ncbi:hypothetical protein Acr_03g0007020 [Actinidia rufa]|uniref:Tetratricopeptide repeat (TPR)-like superfamily protein n=1 Tax=Actinidia rufa TaxID=165716 RepID=A0A7J0EBT5_9ERIC|nr:hypothetical protein Acr_03g0007020 [Actinidia rufa]
MIVWAMTHGGKCRIEEDNLGTVSGRDALVIVCQERAGDSDKALSVLAEMEAVGFGPNASSYIGLITALGKIGFLRKGFFRLADKVLVAIDELGIGRNRETYGILLDYYVHAGHLEDTWSIIGEMRREGFKLNSFVYSKVIGLSRDNEMRKKAMGIHGRFQDAEDSVNALKLEVIQLSVSIFCVLANAYAQQVPVIYNEMESAGFTLDRNAREMLQTSLMILQQRH